MSSFIRAQVVLEVLDIKTHEPLVYVNVIVDTLHQSKVLHTDENGRVVLPAHTRHVILSYYGYEDQVLILEKEVDKSVEMRSASSELDEVVLESKENPAWSLLRRVRRRKDSLNPYHRFRNFKYREYNKVSTKIHTDKSIDSLGIPFGGGPFLSDPDKANMLQSEYVLEGYYQRYQKTKFKLIGTKFSGFKEKSVLNLSSNVAPFHFFDDYVFLISKQFLNPVVDRSYDQYIYQYIDTASVNGRLAHHISFKPTSSINPQRLVGEFYIDAQDYALAKIVAKPSVPQGMYVAIDQLYQKNKQGYWLPKDLRYSWFVMKIGEADVVNHGQSIFSNYIFNSPEIDTITFDAEGVVFTPKAARKGDEFWNTNRKIKLTRLEQNTYKKFDSLNLDYWAEAAEKLGLKQQIQLGILDVDIRHLLVNDNTYGRRLGIGVYTNQVWTDRVYIGGYATYSKNSDKEIDWGASILVNVDKETKSKIILSYTQDYLKNNPKNYYEFLSYDLNYTNELRLNYEFIYDYYDFDMYLAYQDIQFYDTNVNTLFGIESFTEIGVDVNFDYYKSYLPSYVDPYSVRRSKRFNVQRWIPNIDVKLRLGQHLGDSFDPYGKVTIGVQNRFISKLFQEIEMRLELGTILGPTPVEKLFTGKNMFGGSSMWYLINMFQTVKPSEFIQEEYAALFLRYNFFNLRLPWQYTSPRFHLIHNIGLGTVELTERVKLRYMDKPLLEIGLLVQDIVQYPILGIGALGGGLGVFGRYGSLANSNHNLTMKANFSFTF